MSIPVPTKKLAPFEGRDVISAGIEIPDASGGLKEPLKAEPVELGLNQEVFVVMRLAVRKVRFDEVKDTDALTRTHIMRTVEATFIDGDTVMQALDEQRFRIERARGQESLDFGAKPELVAVNGAVGGDEA